MSHTEIDFPLQDHVAGAPSGTATITENIAPGWF